MARLAGVLVLFAAVIGARAPVRAITQDLPILAPSPAAETPATARDADVVAAPTADNPEATVAEAAGTIAVDQGVSDEQVERKLRRLLPQYPGVRQIDVSVEEGVVTLTGVVESDEARDRLRDFVRRVEGVNLILNQTKTDAQVLTAPELARKRLGAFWDALSQKWLLILGGLAIFALSIMLARAFWRFADVLLAPLMSNVLLRSVLGSLVGGGDRGRRLRDRAVGAGGRRHGVAGAGAGRRAGPRGVVRLPRHRRELHRVDLAGCPTSLPHRRLRRGRRAYRGRQGAEHPGDDPGDA